MVKRKKLGKQLVPAAKGQNRPTLPDQLFADVRELILRTREGVAQAVNSALVLLYREVGRRIRSEILKQERAAYGEEIV